MATKEERIAEIRDECSAFEWNRVQSCTNCEAKIQAIREEEPFDFPCQPIKDIKERLGIE